MSASEHPVALRLESLVGGNAKLLALVMMLPLIDGVFPALILAGALDEPLGAIQVGLLIFGGSATVAVILAEMTGSPREQAGVVLLVGIPLILLSAVQAALAPAIESVIDILIFERFAALVILAIAAKTASATVGEYLPSPGVIIGLGLVASIDPTGMNLVLMNDPALVANSVLAAAIGVAFALAVALSGPYLREYMDLDRFRFGSAVALGLLPMALVADAFGQAPLAALIVAAIFAIDPPLERAEDEEEEFTAPAVGTGPLPDGGSWGSGSDSGSSQSTSPRPSTTTTTTTSASASASVNPRHPTVEHGANRAGPDLESDDGTDGEPENEDETESEDETEETYPGDDTTDTAGRAPWL
ncbi:hypothetical protein CHINAEXTREME_13040 [Halobiforma lacisalsi AJ5]|uniref:Uncharacterized protein n=1 Tax=Natronobacterium lacisalsi AJ5 TaxID=358396 RepID=M0LJD6_NATLA|nr:DUF5794 domain-containing protein [Halobiforma lacisalsi]APW98645.1 hypothetical protein CHINAEXTREME_13040 [Halobiforma lacisalsi AJ5]EMA32514.1 hypothetical protein C445_10372 [Halobiforma lacisalsi AJ5]